MKFPAYYPLSRRLLSGLTAGILLGILVGTAISIWVITSRDPHQPAVLKSQLTLHLSAIYGLLLLIPGLLISTLVIGKRKDIGLFASVIIVLGVLLTFYYGRNIFAFYVVDRATGGRWIYEILGTATWLLVCWLFYKLLVILEKRFRGMTLTITFLVVALILVWNLYTILKPSSASHSAVAELDLPIPNEDIKVALIGFDSAWWEMMTPLLKEGSLPNFKKLMDEGVHAEFETLIPTASPALWTTIITGKLPEKHRITHFRVSRFPVTGAVIPFNSAPRICYEFNWMLGPIIKQVRMNSTFRMTEALWNILSDAGLTVGMVNWWSSYPAESINGFNISIQAYDYLVRSSRGEKREGESVAVYPSHMFSELEPYVIDPLKLPIDSVARFIHIQSHEDRKLYQEIAKIPVSSRGQEMAMVKFYYPWDESVLRMTQYLATTYEQPDFLGVFMDGLDPIQHWYLPFFFHERHQDVLSQININRLKDTVPEYYKYLDEVLGKLVGMLDPNTIFIVVSDHGFDHGLHKNFIYEHENGPPGIFIAAGNNIKRNTTINEASVTDITPTILSIFGLPIGRDMDGRVLSEIFEEETANIQWVDTYDIKPRKMGKPVHSDMDEIHNDRLRALGYIK